MGLGMAIAEAPTNLLPDDAHLPQSPAPRGYLLSVPAATQEEIEAVQNGA